MTHSLDETHAASLTSWVDRANAPACDFPVQNLPFGVFRHGSGERRRIGIAIGDAILDLDACVHAGLFDRLDPAVRSACRSYALNSLCALGAADARRVRGVVSRMLRADTTEGLAARARRDELLRPMSECALTLPAEIGDYTDFYASVHHATSVGSMLRPDNPLLPNYKWVPIGYHGRASSIVPSGTAVRRPRGQSRPDANAPPVFGASRQLDYELEVGALVGAGNLLGAPVPLERAESHLFGFCLMNDWSARDIQSWESQPLGPFLSKSFGTTMSPWVVTNDALVPFRSPPPVRSAADPALLSYLDDADDRASGAFDISLEIELLTPRMRETGARGVRLSRSEFREMYWTPAQMLAHHTSNGCNLRPGDLLASGTVSGASQDSLGCLLELTRRGARPIALPGGETRTFLEDGDEVIFRGWCEREACRRIGFGECRGVVLPALTD
jgi:fumarylacetoacetase